MRRAFRCPLFPHSLTSARTCPLLVLTVHTTKGAEMFNAGDTIKYEGHKIGTVLQVRDDIIGFTTGVQIIGQYHNKMWFEAELLTAA
ncbi:hypothetical protein FDI26_gp49 [Arthrobacter phage Beans]|uniref:Uncharacterized protein n=1 Tax=Arthrobacter phage Beans TaxID=2015815 RepID=A0A222ZJ15_9CAUD|nr:hypothetical protein FDI26_gp49 [Arthrobacter phage Beans]ASR84744.1 hypothetical protein SEA_BEANS_49 [Arthrobacter phage Beans]